MTVGPVPQFGLFVFDRDAMQKKALVYGQQCLDAADDLAEDILKKVNK